MTNNHKPAGCQKQPYASIEVAEDTVKLLEHAGVEAKVLLNCPDCKWLHVGIVVYE